MKSYIDTIKRINEKEEEFISEEKIIELAEELIAKNSLISGSDYGFQEGVYFTTGKLFTDESFSKAKVFKGKSIEKLYVFIESIREKIKIDVYRKIDCEIVFIGKKSSNSFTVNIDKRINCLMKDVAIDSRVDITESENANEDDSNNLQASGRLYVAKVYDLVEMYNCVGDKLFDKNVRCKISKDVTGVGEAILNTLVSEPEQFWLLNNGITMLTEKVDMYKRNSITISCTENNYFSIINGAQTISTCADFFFGDSYTEEQKNYAKENAYVILRTVSIKGSDSREVKQMESKISVSLNRQKPIDAEDLAYNVPLVSNINNVVIDEKYKELRFKIAKKGEEFLTDKCYTLGQLGKLIYAGKLQSPGAAKNAYTGTLLKTQGDGFRKKDIFKPVDMDDSNAYLKEYCAVNLINRLHEIWVNNRDEFALAKEFDSIKSFWEGSNYYFVSLMMWALFGTEDFVGNSNKLEIIPEKVLLYMGGFNEVNEKLLLVNFLKVINKTSKELDKSLEYNDLKKDDVYNKISKKVANEFKEEVLSLMEKCEENAPGISLDITGPFLEMRQQINDTLVNNTSGKSNNGKLF